MLGCRPPIFLDLPDNRLDAVPLLDIVQRIEGRWPASRPEIIYTHHVGDLNIDHEIVGRAVLTRSGRCRAAVWCRYGFEVLSSTGWKVMATRSCQRISSTSPRARSEDGRA